MNGDQLKYIRYQIPISQYPIPVIPQRSLMQELPESLALGALLTLGSLGTLWFLQRQALKALPYAATEERLLQLARRVALYEKLFPYTVLLFGVPPAFTIGRRLIGG